MTQPARRYPLALVAALAGSPPGQAPANDFGPLIPPVPAASCTADDILGARCSRRRHPRKAPARNKLLGFSLTLDPSHPYLDQRGIPPELRERFGLGYCGKRIMAGRVCIPIDDAEGKLVAYAGRWVGPLEDLPEGKGRYELPAGFRKELELFNLHRVKDCRHLVVVEGFFGAIHLASPHVVVRGEC